MEVLIRVSPVAHLMLQEALYAKIEITSQWADDSKLKLVPEWFPHSETINSSFMKNINDTFVLSYNIGTLTSYDEVLEILKLIATREELIGFGVQMYAVYPNGTKCPKSLLTNSIGYMGDNWYELSKTTELVNISVGYKHNKSVGERNETGEKRVLNFCNKQVHKIE
tara:strand:- start:10168 stop:10668 length:501 start_codon:yes stop_codon:yes gene_type:complete